MSTIQSLASSVGLLVICGMCGVTSACVDAPITQDQLEASGRLRSLPDQASFSTRDRAVVRQAVSVSAILAAQADGPLADRSEFPEAVGEVHLHLRADGLVAARQVVYRWTHDGISVLVPGALAPTESMSLASSFAIEPGARGHWEVDVLASAEVPGDPAVVLAHREFEIQ